MYYRRIHDPKEGELVQYLAVYALNWNKALQPTDAFVEVDDPLVKAAPLLLEACVIAKAKLEELIPGATGGLPADGDVDYMSICAALAAAEPNGGHT